MPVDNSPGGAIELSSEVGTFISITGRFEAYPRFTSMYASSIWNDDKMSQSVG